MRICVKYIVLLTFCFIQLVNGLYSQPRYSQDFEEVAGKYPENILLFTDRTLYAVNEAIQFSALLQSAGKPYRGLGSKVMYLELVNQAGIGVVKCKYALTGNRSHGQLFIPSNLSSGNYYLRCYTKWMRNFGCHTFTYVPLRIVNPFSSNEVLTPGGKEKKDLSAIPEGLRGIKVALSKAVFGRQETAEVEFTLKEGMEGTVEHACLTIVPAGAADSSILIYRVNAVSDQSVSFEFNFLPEVDGITLSGIVYEADQHVPVPEQKLHFTILGNQPDYFLTQSDPQGRFQVKTPQRVGPQELIVIPQSISGTPVDVQIDNDFTSDPLPFTPAGLDFNQEELVTASRVSLNMQLHRVFLEDQPPDDPFQTTAADPVPFYGMPEFTLQVDEFINLPTLEEIVENLIPRVYITRRGDVTEFLIKGEHPMLPLYPPLVLVDLVPVFEMDVILSIPPGRISQIDVVPDVYVLGDTKFGGIISITSVGRDLASIRLPEGSYFFDYDAYQSSKPLPRPKYEGPGNIPDVRNTLYWKHHLALEPDVTHTENFQTASVPGTYIILVRGVLSNGRLIYGSVPFMVE
jgi:hypothetical protein